MSRIPDATSIGLNISSGRQSIATAGGNTAPGFAAIGGAISDMAEVARQKQETDDNYQIKKAEIDFQNGLNELHETYRDDDDHSTLNERHEVAVRELRERIGTRFGDRARAYQEFDLSATEKGGRSQAHVSDIAWTKERDFERGSIAKQLDETQRGALNAKTPEEMQEYIANGEALIGLGEDKGYFSEEEKIDALGKLRVGIAEAKFNMLPPDQRVAATKQPWFKNLPPDTQAVLTREAYDEERSTRVQVQVERWIGSGKDPLAVERAIDAMKDPKDRAEARDQYDTEFRRLERQEFVQRDQIMDEHFLDVREGRKAVADIPKEQRRALSTDQVNSLYAAEKSSKVRDSGPEKSSRVVIDELNQIANGPDGKNKARAYFLEHGHELSDGDYKAWSVATSAKAPGGQALFTAQVDVGVAVRKFYDGKTNKAKADKVTDLVQSRMTAWFLRTQAETGTPTDAEVTAKIIELTNPRQILDRNWINSYETVPTVEAEQNIRDAITEGRNSVQAIKDNDPDWYRGFLEHEKRKADAKGERYVIKPDDLIHTYREEKGF